MWGFRRVTTVLVLVWALAALPCHGGVAEGPGLVITPDMQFSYADQLLGRQEYGAARTEFLRFVHFFSEDPRRDEARYKAAMALYHTGQFPAAARAFNQIILEEDETSCFVKNSFFMQSRAFKAMDNLGYAQMVLQNFLKLTHDPATRDQIYLELADLEITETRKLGRDGLDQARDYLTRIRPAARERLQVPARLNAIGRAKAAPRKNPTLSGALALVPGTGFLYCGRYKDAFVSFCLNTGLMYAAYTAFDHDNPALGGVISFVETGFYTGNIYGSVTAAHKHNKAGQIKILDRVFHLQAGIDPAGSSYLFKLNHPF